MIEISARDARLVLLHEQGLLGDTRRKATPAAVLKVVKQLGFVQLDSIPVVERAQHLTLRARLEGYRPQMLKHLVEKRRALFEHWTHDASIIPVEWYHHWRHRCSRFLDAGHISRWVESRIGSDDLDRVLAETLERIEKEGALRSRDFAPPPDGGQSGWWQWKPHKAALEYLWWAGELSISARERFEKVYDLSHRTYADAHAKDTPPLAETIDFACSEAIARLGSGTPAEIAAFFDIVTVAEARQWCADAALSGRLQVAKVDGRSAFAACDFSKRLRRAERALAGLSDELRLLAPFDPVVRDRKRALRLFGFDYRFEAYVPAPKRVYGYYVLPILQRDQIVGRCDLKTDRKGGRLEVIGIWWEDGKTKATRDRERRFEQALAKLESFVLDSC